MIRSTGAVSQAVKFAKWLGARAYRGLVMAQDKDKPTDENLILLESYLGKRLDCNPKAIYDYLRKSFPGRFHYVWAAEEPSEWTDFSQNPDTRVVKYRSREHLDAACVAGTLITNSPRSNEMPDCKHQVQIMTWHGGGCYKKVGLGVNGSGWASRFITQRQFERYDYFISSSKYFTDEVIRKQYAFQGEVLSCGMPRNDRLVRQDPADRAAVRGALGISDDDLLVLLVPTWRDFGDDIPLPEAKALKKAFERKTGRRVVLGYRGHYFSDDVPDGYDLLLNDFHDMQGLLLACDALVSDFSSVIWDFSFTYRPCLLYVPDLAAYERDRGFDVPIQEWGFPVCQSMGELTEAIEGFDEEDFRLHMERHHKDLGSYEQGNACECVAKVIQGATPVSVRRQVIEGKPHGKRSA